MNSLGVRSNLDALLPCRKKQWGTLLSLLGVGGTVPSSLFVYGHTGSGKTHVVHTTLQQLELNYIRVDCVECDSPSLLVAPIAAKISDVYLQESCSKKCTNFMDLVDIMEKAAQQRDTYKNPFIIVLERSERLRNMPSNVLPALLKLQEISGMNVCVIMVSDIVWEKFYCKYWFNSPIKVFFPQYSKEDIYQIIILKKPDYIEENLFHIAVKLIISILFRTCRDLNELQFMVDTHLPLLKDQENLSSDPKALWKFLAPHLKSSSLKVHLRQGISKVASSVDANPLTSSVSGLELPYYAKYLLIAAFLASFNASRHDRRLFMKFHGKEKKRLQRSSKNQQAA